MGVNDSTRQKVKKRLKEKPPINFVTAERCKKREGEGMDRQTDRQADRQTNEQKQLSCRNHLHFPNCSLKKIIARFLS